MLTSHLWQGPKAYPLLPKSSRQFTVVPFCVRVYVRGRRPTRTFATLPARCSSAGGGLLCVRGRWPARSIATREPNGSERSISKPGQAPPPPTNTHNQPGPHETHTTPTPPKPQNPNQITTQGRPQFHSPPIQGSQRTHISLASQTPWAPAHLEQSDHTDYLTNTYST